MRGSINSTKRFTNGISASYPSNEVVPSLKALDLPPKPIIEGDLYRQWERFERSGQCDRRGLSKGVQCRLIEDLVA